MRAAPGTYALIMRCRAAGSVRVGCLGELAVIPGHYVYVGSAFGPGGVRARVQRHLRGSAARHWHVDYLRPAVAIGEVWCTYDACRREHLWAETVSRGRGVLVPLPGFGASDCLCASHLFYDPHVPSISVFVRRLRTRQARHGPVHRVRIR